MQGLLESFFDCPPTENGKEFLHVYTQAFAEKCSFPAGDLLRCKVGGICRGNGKEYGKYFFRSAEIRAPVIFIRISFRIKNSRKICPAVFMSFSIELTEPGGAHAEFGCKVGGEVRVIGKTAKFADFVNGHIGVLQQRFCIVHSVTHDV